MRKPKKRNRLADADDGDRSDRSDHVGVMKKSEKTLKPDEAEQRLKRFLKASTVSSFAEIEAANVIHSGNPSSLVAKLNLDGFPKTSYWCGVLGVLSNTNDAKARAQIISRMKENYNILNWSERLMLRRLESIR